MNMLPVSSAGSVAGADNSRGTTEKKIFLLKLFLKYYYYFFASTVVVSIDLFLVERVLFHTNKSISVFSLSFFPFS